MSFHFWWYVEHHITPHSLRVMALQSWRTLICHLEAPKGQSGLRDFKVNNKVKLSVIIQSEYKINYLNNKFNGKLEVG